uniref:Uncharacterized protein n=1 Tax=Alexandrium andersonii TaxID=327968 RepID=A0A7S2IL26_9DINO|mmetsp:Transcript_84308/g.188226  ORF Transcript_84308/g.188226 Transcript_84308/m.188226 type:complete len:358 (+) Transcript_84308:109-1182(+)
MFSAAIDRLSAGGGKAQEPDGEPCLAVEGSAEPAAPTGPQRFLGGKVRFVALGLACAALLGAGAFLGRSQLAGAQPAEGSAGALVALDDAQANLATCVIDADQAAFYLIQGINFIRFSVDACKVMTNNDERTACAASVATVIASFGWVGSYTAATINSCGSETNVIASCGASMSALVAELGEFSFISSAVVASCDLFTPLEDIPIRDPNDPTKNLDKLTTMEKLDIIKNEKPVAVEDNPLRGWSISQCVADLNIGVTYVGRIGIQTYFLTTECPRTGSNFDRKKCALDIFNVISSIAWAAQFLALAAFDCPEVAATGSACAGVVSDFVAAVAALGPIVNGISDDCVVGMGAGEANFE